MKQKLNLGFVIALTFVIVFIVLKVYTKPNFDYFSSGNLSPQFSVAVETKRKEMNQQMLEQHDQNRRITSLKNKIDSLRNDLKIIKSKEQEELSSIYQQINSQDSLSEAMGVEGGRVLNGMLAGNSNGRGKSGRGAGKGKNYNLNFNLDEE